MWPFFSKSEDLSCKKIHSIQEQFLKYHILSSKPSLELQNRVLDQFVEDLDKGKFYFLKSDIKDIKKQNAHLFLFLEKENCSGLYKIYNIFSRRVKERMVFASKYLDKFVFKKNLKYIVDKKLRKFPSSTQEANKNMETFIQYKVANIFLFEEGLNEAIKNISYIFNNFTKQVLSWEPKLNDKEIKECKDRNTGNFKACKPEKWFYNYLNAYARSLDSHSRYFNREDIKRYQRSRQPKFNGIGLVLRSQFGYAVITDLVPGGAAIQSKKIKVDDTLLAVGQERKKMIPVFGERIEDIASILEGETGQAIYLKVLRKEQKRNKVFVVQLIIKSIDIKEELASISYHNINKHKVGLLKIPYFYGGGTQSITKDVKRLLIEARRKGVDSLILDLSYNYGGLLAEAVDVSGLFFSKGNVVARKIKEKNSIFIKTLGDTDKRIFYKGPLVVLVNPLSSSASEIVSGVLKDYKRALIVGSHHTYGKGSIQSFVESFQGLNQSALYVTTGVFFTPSGRSIQTVGVNSDIVFPNLLDLKMVKKENLPTKNITSFYSSPKEIFPLQGDIWKVLNPALIKSLKNSSEKRMRASKEFEDVIHELERLQEKEKDRKIVTIYRVLKNRVNQEPSKSLFQIEVERNEKYFERLDVKEALNVASDLAILINREQKPPITRIVL